MTDAGRIVAARALLAEIAHALDCCEAGLRTGAAELREAGAIAAMLAAAAIIHRLGRADAPD